MRTTKIKFRKETEAGFYSTLKQRVSDFLKCDEDRICYLPGLKSIFLSLLFVLFFSSICLNPGTAMIICSYIMLGMLTTGILLNIVHDAVHNVLFRSSRLNSLAALWMELLGSDAYIWKRRHITFHHSYPNIIGHDTDIRQSSIIRILPKAEYRKFHRYQHYYMPFLYFFFTLNWFFNRDFSDAFFHNIELHISKARRIKLFVQKTVYLFVYLVFPSIVTGTSIWVYLAGFLSMHFTASIIGVFVLTTSHVNHDSVFPEPDENGMMADSWAMHQLRVTQDFSTGNFLINNSFGGFNFHVAHHLFPSLHHRHYQKITRIIRATASEFGLEYKCKPITKALWSHYKLLISNSRPLEIDL